ncbi:hypothetical protein pEaSNUABM54_00157 [Erwinia phage pEa_SNUABM_54]|nr:hypothetical protein pEaSNUABM54_00157 [Erwinia phage pEa_SNUABM_54]
MENQKPLMSPFEPFLAKAAVEWVEKNNGQPHLVVHAAGVGERALIDTANETGSAFLNIAPNAIGGIEYGDEYITLQCAFRGRRTTLFIYYAYLLGVLDKSNGAFVAITDMAIAQAVYETGGPENITHMEVVPNEPVKASRPKLTIVK